MPWRTPVSNFTVLLSTALQILPLFSLRKIWAPVGAIQDTCEQTMLPQACFFVPTLARPFFLETRLNHCQMMTELFLLDQYLFDQANRSIARYWRGIHIGVHLNLRRMNSQSAVIPDIGAVTQVHQLLFYHFRSKHTHSSVRLI